MKRKINKKSYKPEFVNYFIYIFSQFPVLFIILLRPKHRELLNGEYGKRNY